MRVCMMKHMANTNRAFAEVGNAAQARGLIRELARQDRDGETYDDFADHGNPEAAVETWLDEAAAVGDTGVFDAVEILGIRTAAAVYAEARS